MECDKEKVDERVLALMYLVMHSDEYATPYFRISNPLSQAKKFDRNCGYIGRWLPDRDTPNYPMPIVNHARARERALDALAAIKNK